MFHALLIGIDYYVANQLSNGGSYRSLAGCVNDVARVEAMLRHRLRDVDAAGQLTICTLIAPNDHGRPGGDPARWPTAAAIRAALANLGEHAQPGDQVYVHYAGHGGRVTTLWPDIKGELGEDEALVPMDIGDAARGHTCADRYVRDVELAWFLDRLASKRGADGSEILTTLVFDSCHSGGATRSAETTWRRCATDGDPSHGDPYGTLDRPSTQRTSHDLNAMADAWLRLCGSGSGGRTRAAVPARTPWLPPARSYVLLAACLEHQAALEVSLDDATRHGVLTHAYLEAIASLEGAQSWQAVFDRVHASVHHRFPEQTPQLIGDLDRQVLGLALLPLRRTLIVIAIDAVRRRVLLDGGQTLALGVGAELAIFPPGETDFTKVERRLALATLTQDSAFTSCGELPVDTMMARIVPGAPAVVVRHAKRWGVELRSDLPARPALEAAIFHQASHLLDVGPARATTDWQVTVDATGHYEICDAHGVPLPYLEPRIAVEQADAVRAVVDQLRRLARFHTVRAMSSSSSLADELESQLLRAPDDWDPGQPPDATGGTPLEQLDGAYHVSSGTWLWLRLTNRRPERPLYVTLIALTRTWKIEMIVPNSSEVRGRHDEIITDRPRTFAFQMYTPIARTEDILRLFITLDGVDLHRLGVLDPAPAPAPGPPPGVYRDARPARAATSLWAVREMIVQTVR